MRHTRFEKEVGISNGYLNTTRQRNGDLGESILRKILQSDSKLSAVWLLTGAGSMFSPEDGNAVNAVAEEVYLSATNNRFFSTTVDDLRLAIRAQEKTITAQEKTIAALETQIELTKAQH